MAAIGGLLPVVLYSRTPLQSVRRASIFVRALSGLRGRDVRGIPGGALSLRYRAAPEGAGTAVDVEKVMGS